MKRTLLIALVVIILEGSLAFAIREKRTHDKSYIAASGALLTGSVLLLCVNPLIGGSFLVLGGAIHLVKSLHGNKKDSLVEPYTTAVNN